MIVSYVGLIQCFPFTYGTHIHTATLTLGCPIIYQGISSRYPVIFAENYYRHDDDTTTTTTTTDTASSENSKKSLSE